MSVIVTDANYRDIVRQSEDAGHLAGCLPRQTPVGGLACAPVMSEHVPLIPESEWEDRIKFNTEKKLWIGDKWQSDPKADYQNGLGFCWAYSLCQAVMAVRKVQLQPFVQLSPESLAEDVGYRNRGNSLDSAIAYAAENGIATRKTVPQHKISPSQWDAAYKDERQNHIPLEWYDLDESAWKSTVAALLEGYGCYVGLSWASHAVWYDRLRINNGQIEVHTPNSHGPDQDWWLSGSRRYPDMASFALRSVTLATH